MKIRILPLLLMLIVLLTSCKKSEPIPDNTTGEDDGIVYSEPDVSGTNVTYILTDSGYIPISLCEGGYSMLSGENYYYNVQNAVSNSRNLDGKTYTAFTDSGINLGPATVDGKSEHQPHYTLLTSGNWKLCPNIRKTVYDKNKADSSFGQFIAESFADNFKSAADVKITDIWEYDVDADKMSEAIVLAKAKDYAVLAFLSQTLGNKILASSFSSDTDYVAVPFFADLDGNGTYSLVTVWGGGLKTVTVYKEGSFEEDYRVYLPI